MSIEAMSWAKKQRTPTTGTQCVLYVLCDYAHPETAACHPTQERIADEARMSVRSVQRHLETLEELGYITSKQRSKGKEGADSKMYRVLLHANLALSTLPHAKTKVATRQPRRTNGINSKVKTKTSLTSSTGFEEAWRAYPKRAGGNPRIAAEKQWNARLKQGHTADEMYDGTIRYALYVEAVGNLGTEYVMMARTFYGPQLLFLEPWEPARAKPQQAKRRHDPDDEASYIGTVVV